MNEFYRAVYADLYFSAVMAFFFALLAILALTFWAIYEQRQREQAEFEQWLEGYEARKAAWYE